MDADTDVLFAVDLQVVLASWLASVLAGTSARLGSSDAFTAGRPGSWEASLAGQRINPGRQQGR